MKKRFRLESRSRASYTVYTARSQGSAGWTRRDEFGQFDTLDAANSVAFTQMNSGQRDEVFAVVEEDVE